MGVDYVVVGFDMEVQPLVTRNAAWPLCVSTMCIGVMSSHLLFARAYVMSTVGIDVMSVYKLFAYRVLSTVRIDVVSSHMKYCRTAYGITI